MVLIRFQGAPDKLYGHTLRSTVTVHRVDSDQPLVRLPGPEPTLRIFTDGPATAGPRDQHDGRIVVTEEFLRDPDNPGQVQLPIPVHQFGR